MRFDFTDERGLQWEMSDFCAHYRINAETARKLFRELESPTVLDTRDFVQSCAPNTKIIRRVILILPGGRKRVFPSATIMSKFAEEFAAKNLPSCKQRKERAYRAAWLRLGRKQVVDLQELLENGIAPKAQKAIKEKERVEKRLTGKGSTLAAIPGPSKYELAYLDDAGKFGAGQIQRENFAGRCQGGAPIYTGR